MIGESGFNYGRNDRKQRVNMELMGVPLYGIYKHKCKYVN